MRLTYSALSMLAKKYRSILRKCLATKLMAGILAGAAMCGAGPCMASAVEMILPAGQTLVVSESVSGEGNGIIQAGATVIIEKGASVIAGNSSATNLGNVEISGTLHFYDTDFVNDGTVTVTSSGLIKLGEKLTNNGNLAIAGTVVHPVPAQNNHTGQEIFLENNGNIQVAATYIEGNNPASYYGGLRLISKNEFDSLLNGSVVLGHIEPVENMAGSMLLLSSPDTPVSLNTSDFITGTTPQKGKFLMAAKGVMYFSNTRVAINGDSLELGPARSADMASLCTDVLELDPQAGDTFTLKSGRFLINGVNKNPYVKIKDGAGTLHINGGRVQLGQPTTGANGGKVEGSIRVGTENLPASGAYDSSLRISAGDWNISGDLTLEKSGDLSVGQDSDVNTQEPIAANLTIDGSFTMNGGRFTGSNISTFKADTLIGNENFVLNIGGAVPGRLEAGHVQLHGGQINFDPPFIADGDTSNASMGALNFESSSVDARINAGRNSMVTLGSVDPEWLRTQIGQYQTKTGNIWGRDITAAFAVRSPQKLAANGGLNVDGTWTSGGEAAMANRARFAANSLFVVDGAGIGSSAALDGNGTASLVVEPGARLYVTDGAVGDSIIITDNFASSEVDPAGWVANTTSPLQAATAALDEQGRFVVGIAKGASPAIAFPLLGSELDAVLAMAALTGLDTNSPAAGTRFISRAVDNRFIGASNPDLAGVTIESAARMAVAGAVPQMTLAANTAAGAAITQRTGMAQPSGIVQSVDLDGHAITEPEEHRARQFALWIMPLYQSANGFGMEAGKLSYDFNGALGGVALGADYTFESMLRLGLTFNIGGGYARGGGDMNTSKNNMSFWGLGAYAGWNCNNFGLTADLNFTSTYNKLRQDLPGELLMKELKGDVTGWALSTGLRAEYRLVTDYLDIVPHAGFRYVNLNTDSYDIKSNGTVLDGDSFTQNIWTFPLGLSISKSLELENGWHWKPLADLCVTPAAGDIKAKSNVRFAGINQEADLRTKMMDYITYGGTAGVEFGNDTVSVGVNYNGQFGATSSAHGIFGTFRVEF